MKKPETLKKVKKAYLVGIKGVAMTALACCYQDLGIKVTGCDVEEKFVTDEILEKRRIKWQVGFEEERLQLKPDLVVTTAAHGGLSNPQVLAAKKKKIPLLTHAQALGQLMTGKEGISVCGVGGKSTVSAMIATILALAGRKPSYAVGVASIKPLGAAGKYDQGREFVAEADEYANSPGVDNRARFSFQNPKVIVVTNIEYDHPDIYQDLNHLKSTFKKFFLSLPRNGLLVACIDNPQVQEVLKSLEVSYQTYGLSPQADWRIERIYHGQEQIIFNLSYQGGVIDQIKIKVPGKYNVLNATAALAVATFLGLDAKTIKKGLAEFRGTRRRFEFIGEKKGVKLYDDYAHHPEEIKAALTAARKWFPGQKIIAVFQPHTYSRTKALLKDFSRAFSQAHQVVITDIYASAREKNDLGVSGRLLAEETAKFHPRVRYLSGEKKVANYLSKNAQAGDIIMTMGAGNIFQWHSAILKILNSP